MISLPPRSVPATPTPAIAVTPNRATPWWAYLLAVLIAVMIGTAAAYPKALIVVILGCIVLAVTGAAFRDPWFALAIVVAQYPLVPTLRTLYTAFNYPVFTSGTRLFPELLQLLIVAHLLIRAAKNPEMRLRIHGDDLPVLAYVIVGCYSFYIGWVNVHPFAPVNGWFVSMTPPMFYLIIRWLKPTRAQITAFLKKMTTIYVLVALPSLWVYLARPTWYMQMANAEHPFFVGPNMDAMLFWKLYPRMQSFLFEENVWGTLSELVAVMAAAYLMRNGSRKWLYALFFLASIGLVLSISRGAILAFVIALVALLLMRGAHRRRVALLLTALGVAGIIGMVALQKMTIVSSVLTRFSTMRSAPSRDGSQKDDRVEQWKQGWDIFVREPSGKGLGTVGYGASLSKVSDFQVGDGLYFRILAEQGVPGIVVFVYLIGSTGWILWRYLAVCPTELRPLGTGLLAFHLGFCIHGISANTYDYYCVAAIYFILFGLFVSGTHAYIDQQRRILAAKVA